MKDKNLQGKVEWALEEIRQHQQLVNHNILDNISIKDCPKCKHPVLAKKIPDPSYNTITHITTIATLYDSWYSHPTNDTYQCFTCGKEFTCSTKEVCEVIE